MRILAQEMARDLRVGVDLGMVVRSAARVAAEAALKKRRHLGLWLRMLDSRVALEVPAVGGLVAARELFIDQLELGAGLELAASAVFNAEGSGRLSASPMYYHYVRQYVARAQPALLGASLSWSFEAGLYRIYYRYRLAPPTFTYPLDAIGDKDGRWVTHARDHLFSQLMKRAFPPPPVALRPLSRREARRAARLERERV